MYILTQQLFLIRGQNMYDAKQHTTIRASPSGWFSRLLLLQLLPWCGKHRKPRTDHDSSIQCRLSAVVSDAVERSCRDVDSGTDPTQETCATSGVSIEHFHGYTLLIPADNM